VTRLPSAQKKGYTKKPMFIYGVSFALILLPLAQFFLSLSLQPINNKWSFEFFSFALKSFSFSQWALIFLTMLSGVLLLFARKITLWTSVAVFVFIFFVNLFFYNRTQPAIVIIPALLVFTPFAKPYRDKTLRWWEQAKRFFIPQLRAEFENGKKFEVKNISASGICILIADINDLDMKNNEVPNSTTQLRLDKHPHWLKVRVARHSQNEVAFEFLFTKKEQKSFAVFLETLQKT